jgi:hypothetical protein
LVLALPAFAWFKADYPAINARKMHTCIVVGRGGSQKAVVGGLATNSPAENQQITWTNERMGSMFSNLSAMRWEDEYEAYDTNY